MPSRRRTVKGANQRGTYRKLHISLSAPRYPRHRARSPHELTSRVLRSALNRPSAPDSSLHLRRTDSSPSDVADSHVIRTEVEDSNFQSQDLSTDHRNDSFTGPDWRERVGEAARVRVRRPLRREHRQRVFRGLSVSPPDVAEPWVPGSPPPGATCDARRSRPPAPGPPRLGAVARLFSTGWRTMR